MRHLYTLGWVSLLQVNYVDFIGIYNLKVKTDSISGYDKKGTN